MQLSNFSPIFLWGFGSGFMTWSLFVAKRYGIKSKWVYDQKLGHYEPTEQEKERGLVVITVGKRHLHADIIEQIKAIGFKHYCFATDIYEYHLPFPDPDLMALGSNFYVKHAQAIHDAFTLLTDKHSQEIFTTTLKIHMHKNVLTIPMSLPELQYFPNDLHDLDYSRFITCGAYEGDTIKALYALKGTQEAIAAFEPDSKNYVHLSRYLRSTGLEIANTVVSFPCGLSNKTGQAAFNHGDSVNAAFSAGAVGIAQAVAIDDALPNFRPTMIQADVEGAEMRLLEGARQTIIDHRPGIAICTYHTPNHIWEIPNWIHSLDLGYRFYLRNYSGHTAETVLYAVPNKTHKRISNDKAMLFLPPFKVQ
jgi:FkbM family methyltransferase